MEVDSIDAVRAIAVADGVIWRPRVLGLQTDMINAVRAIAVASGHPWSITIVDVAETRSDPMVSKPIRGLNDELPFPRLPLGMRQETFNKCGCEWPSSS